MIFFLHCNDDPGCLLCHGKVVESQPYKLAYFVHSVFIFTVLLLYRPTLSTFLHAIISICLFSLFFFLTPSFILKFSHFSFSIVYFSIYFYLIISLFYSALEEGNNAVYCSLSFLIIFVSCVLTDCTHRHVLTQDRGHASVVILAFCLTGLSFGQQPYGRRQKKEFVVERIAKQLHGYTFVYLFSYLSIVFVFSLNFFPYFKRFF